MADDGSSGPAPVNLSGKSLLLISSDGGEVTAPIEIINESDYLSSAFTDEEVQDGVRHEVMLVRQRELERCVEFYRKYLPEPFGDIFQPLKSPSLTENGVPEKFASMVDGLSVEDLTDLASAASDLGFKQLVTLCAARFACLIKQMSDEEYAATFALSRDFTPEEEAKVREAYKWAES